VIPIFIPRVRRLESLYIDGAGRQKIADSPNWKGFKLEITLPAARSTRLFVLARNARVLLIEIALEALLGFIR